MEITVSPTFVPKDIDPTKSESRHLGAVIEQAGFQPTSSAASATPRRDT
jgi:hypothetical protein